MADNDKRDPYADEVASAKALMSEKQYNEQPWGDWAGDAVSNALNTAKSILPTALGGEGSVGISDMARGAYEGAKDAVTFPGDVLTGKQALYDESGRPLEGAVGRSFNTVGAVGGASSVVPVPSNSLRVFGGSRSRTADKNALTQAQILESQAADRDAIWRQSGWGRGAEGRWRYEIPDVGTTVDPSKFNLDLSSTAIPSSMVTTLGEYINHPELFDAYPEFKTMPVKGYYDPNSNVNGYYMPRYSRGTINPGFSDPYIALNLSHLPTVEAQRATLLHEIQHAIQQKEGFVPGTNVASRPLQTANPLHAFYKDALKTEPELQELEALRATDAFKAEQAEKQVLFAEFQKKVQELDERQAATGVSTKQEYVDAVNDYMKKTEGKFPLAVKAARLGFDLEDRGIPSSEPPEFLDQEGAYLADAGEVESRNVQNRKDAPREELKERPPWRTQDRSYPYEGQIIDWNNTSWRKGYAGRGRVAKGIADEVVGLAKRILGGEPEVRKVTGSELLKKTEGLTEDPFKFSKFSKPLSEMEYTVKMLPREEYKTLDPHELVKKNATIVGHISDRTAAGREISNIGGVDLTEPLTQRGGVDYQRTTPHAWANRPGAAQTLYQKVNEPAGYEWDKKAKQFVKTGEQEGPVYTTPIFMGAPSANSSHMVGVPFLRMVPSMPISKADKLAFDAMMSERFPGWPGIENTKAAEDFLYHGNLPKNAPTAFTKYASAKKWRLGAGFPDIEEIMFSAMDPRLVGIEQGTTGMGFKEIEPNKKIIVKGENYHPDYPAAIPGKEYAGGFRYQIPQGLMFPEWWSKLKPELRLPENATGAQYAAMTQLPTQKATPEWADRILEYWEENPIPWGYADGGEVDDDVNDALRIAKDVGGATGENPQVFLTDAQGRQYDVQGNPIQPAQTQAQSNSAATDAAPTPEQVGRRAAEDPATFDAMIKRYAVPDRDIADYEALQKEVAQQPQQVQQMTHVGAPPMRDIKVDMPLFGGEYNVGQAPYNIANPMSGVAQTAYDLKTVPLYFTPWTAPIGAGLDVAEGVATGDPLTASLAIGFGPGGKMAKAAGIGAANYLIDPSEAEAGPARWFSKAMEVANAIPMNKMTGEQALAMLRKGTSPEELRWTGTDVFLQGKPTVTKDELVDYLNKNRLQLNEIKLGGEKPKQINYLDQVDKDILDRYEPQFKAAEQNHKKALDYFHSVFGSEAEESAWKGVQDAKRVETELQMAAMQEMKDRVGIYRPSKYGPDSSYQGLYTPGGTGYRENLYQFPQRDIYTPYVEQMKKDFWKQTYDEFVNSGFDDARARKMADRFTENTVSSGMAKALGREEEFLRIYKQQKDSEKYAYKSGHWQDWPDVLFHTRTQELTYDPPGANRPYRVHNVDEAQSDLGQAARGKGFYDPEEARKWEADMVSARKARDDAMDNFGKELERFDKKFIEDNGPEPRGTNPAFHHWYEARQDAVNADEGIVAARQKMDEAIKKYDEFDVNRAPVRGKYARKPFVTSTEGWTDRAIKHEIDKALDNGSDYFSWTPGEAHVERYDLSRHIGKVQYNPDDGSLLAYSPDGKMVLNESVNDPDDLDEYLGKELADKMRTEADNRRSAIDEYEIAKDEETGEWNVYLYGEPASESFYSKGEAKDYLNEIIANDFANNPAELSGLDLKVGGEGMIGYYDKIYLKRVQEVMKKATGQKPEIEVIEVQTSAGPRKQLGIRLTDEMREKARFSDFNRGGTVTGKNNYGNDPAVDSALALTREY